MYIKASENLDMGCDVTPEIPPLSWALSDFLLSSRCSACFSKLDDYHYCTAHCGGSVIYCSQQCRDSDIHTHLHSGECHLLNYAHAHPLISTCDLRAALRLLFRHQSSPSSHNPRIANLMTNHEYLLGRSKKRKRKKSSSSTNGYNSDCEEFAQEIEEGARVMHLARKHVAGGDGDGYEQRVEEAGLCAVITNGVQVQLDQLQQMPTGGSEMQCLVMGTAVYGPLFSWCNHSCRPNACYRFVLNTGGTAWDSQIQQKNVSGNNVFIQPGNEDLNIVSLSKKTRHKVHGPGVVLRTIRRVSKEEEIFITYTDLMQPKETRWEELWLKYRFICHCKRCDLPMTAYMDRILQEINDISMIQPSCEIDCNETKSVEALMDEIKYGIDEFISYGDADIFTRTLESVLGTIIASKEFVISENQLQSGGSVFQIHPLHHLCLAAYTSLASAYRIRANDEFHCSSNNHDLASGAFDFSDLLSVSTSADNAEPVSRDHGHDVHFNSPLIEKRHCINTSARMCNPSGLTGLLDSPVVAGNENCYCQCSIAMENRELIKASDSNRAAAAYTLLLAGAVHHFFLAGEQGLIMTAARFWMTAGEALLRWILDCGFQTSISETNCHSIRNRLHLMFGSLSQCMKKCDCLLLNNRIGVLQYKSGCLYGKFHEEDLANGHGYPLLLSASASFLRCMNKFVKLLWPSLRSGFLFLEAILNPVDYNWLPDSQRQQLLNQYFLQNKVERNNDEKEDGYSIDLKERDSSKSSSLEIPERIHLLEKGSPCFCSCMKREIYAIQCAAHCLCYSKSLSEICYGSDHPMVYYIQSLL